MHEQNTHTTTEHYPYDAHVVKQRHQSRMIYHVSYQLGLFCDPLQSNAIKLLFEI